MKEGTKNMGLEKYNMVVNQSIVQTDIPMFRSIGEGVYATKTYITGINEEALDVQNMEEGEAKAAKIATIRRMIARAERSLAGNLKLNPEVKDIESIPYDEFYSKVTTFKSSFTGITTPTYWDKMEVIMGNDGVMLDPENVRHQLIVSCVEVGGYVMIAKSQHEASTSAHEYKFYLDRKTDTAETESVDLYQRDKAGSKLLALREGDSNKLFYIAKILSLNSLYLKDGKNATPLGILYKEISDYLDGKGEELSKKRACDDFLKLCEKNLGELKVRATVKDAVKMNLIVLNNSTYMHLKTSTLLGNSEEEVVLFLQNVNNHKKIFEPIHADVYRELSK